MSSSTSLPSQPPQSSPSSASSSSIAPSSLSVPGILVVSSGPVDSSIAVSNSNNNNTNNSSSFSHSNRSVVNTASENLPDSITTRTYIGNILQSETIADRSNVISVNNNPNNNNNNNNNNRNINSDNSINSNRINHRNNDSIIRNNNINNDNNNITTTNTTTNNNSINPYRINNLNTDNHGAIRDGTTNQEILPLLTIIQQSLRRMENSIATQQEQLHMLRSEMSMVQQREVHQPLRGQASTSVAGVHLVPHSIAPLATPHMPLTYIASTLHIHSITVATECILHHHLNHRHPAVMAMDLADHRSPPNYPSSL